MNKISAVYKIVNTVTNDCYVGSSKDVKRRWTKHKYPSTWKEYPNSPLYKDMQKYGIDKFRFQILAPVMPEYLKQVEQELIDLIQPTYNIRRANDRDAERRKEYLKEYHKEYHPSDKCKELYRKGARNYRNRLCSYNGETLTLGALATRFRKVGIKHSTLEAKKYLLK